MLHLNIVRVTRYSLASVAVVEQTQDREGGGAKVGLRRIDGYESRSVVLVWSMQLQVIAES